MNRAAPRKAASGREPESTILARQIVELSAVQRIETVGTRPPISLPQQSSGWDDSGIELGCDKRMNIRTGYSGLNTRRTG